MKRIAFTLVISTLLFSCTHIVTSNYPGKEKSTLPKVWKGEYTIEYPAFLEMFMGNDKKVNKAKITSKGIEWVISGESSVYTTSDSLKYSQLNGENYLSLHNSHGQYTVFKVKAVSNGLDLYGLTTEAEIEKDKLENYFKKVEQLEVGDENDETGIRLFQVELDDEKLDAFFKSELASKEPIKLRRARK